MLALVCPNISCTLFTSAPLLNSNVAQLCLKSFGDISGRPFDRIKRFTLCVTAAGSFGAKILFPPGKIKLSSRIVFGCSAMRCALSAFNSFSVLLISGIVRRLADVFGVLTVIPLFAVYSVFSDVTHLMVLNERYKLGLSVSHAIHQKSNAV